MAASPASEHAAVSSPRRRQAVARCPSQERLPHQFVHCIRLLPRPQRDRRREGHCQRGAATCLAVPSTACCWTPKSSTSPTTSASRKPFSAPQFHGGLTHYGTSVGFLTGATTRTQKHAIFNHDTAVHYTLSLDAKRGTTPSISSAVGALRRALLEAVTSNETISDSYSEKAYLKKVVAGDLALVITGPEC